MSSIHPREALFEGERPFPILPSCEHFAGSEKLIGKAFELQKELGPVFDITMDCEDGAKEGQEKPHAEMVVAMAKSSLKKHRKAGVRIHDARHALWRQDVDILVPAAGNELAYITIPKPTCVKDAAEQISYIQQVAKKAGISRHGQPVAPEGASARNPAFDVTPARLLTAVVTENGVIYPPLTENLSRSAR